MTAWRVDRLHLTDKNLLSPIAFAYKLHTCCLYKTRTVSCVHHKHTSLVFTCLLCSIDVSINYVHHVINRAPVCSLRGRPIATGPGPRCTASQKVSLSSRDLPLQVKSRKLKPRFVSPFEVERMVNLLRFSGRTNTGIRAGSAIRPSSSSLADRRWSCVSIVPHPGCL